MDNSISDDDDDNNWQLLTIQHILTLFFLIESDSVPES